MSQGCRGADDAQSLQVFADCTAAAAALAERRAGRAVGHPEHRAFSVRPAVDVDHPGDNFAGARCVELFMA